MAGAWVDVNNDGLLDLIVMNYLKWSFDQEPVCEGYGHRDYCHPKMYKPTRTSFSSMREMARSAIAPVDAGFRAHPGQGHGRCGRRWAVERTDGPDRGNDKLMNSFFVNKGGGKFEEAAFEQNLALREDGVYISGMGVDFRDIFDNDGYPDIFLVALDGETFPLYRNTGKGSFAEGDSRERADEADLADGGLLSEYRRLRQRRMEGHLRFQGHVQSLLSAPNLTIEQPNTVFRNLGGMKFSGSDGGGRLRGGPPCQHCVGLRTGI